MRHFYKERQINGSEQVRFLLALHTAVVAVVLKLVEVAVELGSMASLDWGKSGFGVWPVSWETFWCRREIAHRLRRAVANIVTRLDSWISVK